MANLLIECLGGSGLVATEALVSNEAQEVCIDQLYKTVGDFGPCAG